MATAVVDVDLADGYRALTGLDPYPSAFVLFRWRGVPVGYTRVPVTNGVISPERVEAAARVALGGDVEAAALDRRRQQIAPPSSPTLPSASVVICTRDRPENLRRCLTALMRARPADVEVLVVDNAPSDARTAAVAAAYDVRYVLEPHAGLNRARATGARHATGEVILYTDDDTVVDPAWVSAMRAPFSDARVGGVTGLVLPGELETEAQELFEAPYGGFVKRFVREEYSSRTLAPLRADVIGAGASFAVRRHMVVDEGIFDVPLDAGTPAQSGGDTYALFRLLRSGHHVVATPAALTWHWHRRSLVELRRQLVGYGAGTYAFLTYALLHHGEWRALGAMLRRYPPYFAAVIWRAVRRRTDALPLSLALAEPSGAVRGVAAGLRARRTGA